jgi:hypothetical protein
MLYPAMKLTGLRYTESFQRGTAFESECPLEEAWSRIGRLGSAEHLRSVTDSASPPTDEFVQYVVVRIRQAVEFREAARTSTLLTSPLPLYYACLNLTRTCIALRGGKIPSKWHHGLRFRENASDLLQSEAILRDGTFQDYLDAMGVVRTKLTLSLADALARIIEIHQDFAGFRGHSSLVAPVKVEAFLDGPVLLHFPEALKDFPVNWQREFSKVASECALESDGNTLRVRPEVPTSSPDAIASFLNRTLENDLLRRQRRTWYLMRETDQNLVLPRPAYYFLALFILGNVVRYEPELLVDVTKVDSEIGWLLRRVVAAAERFYPQLMLGWLHSEPVYF